MPAFIYERTGGIAWLTVNRPEVHNAMNREVWEGLLKAWIEVRDDPEVRVAVVTGAGDETFSAGGDLKEMAEWIMTPAQGHRDALIPENSPMRFMPVWKPFIAAINGLCVGGGLELAMACDIRLAAENAKLGFPEVRHGLVAANSGTQRLSRLVPLGTSLELLLTGDLIDAHEAQRIGLVNKVYPLNRLMPEAKALAEKIRDNAPLAVQAAKELVLRGTDMSLNDGLRLEIEVAERLVRTRDAREGPAAFVQKRKPVWRGE